MRSRDAGAKPPPLPRRPKVHGVLLPKQSFGSRDGCLDSESQGALATDVDEEHVRKQRILN